MNPADQKKSAILGVFVTGGVAIFVGGIFAIGGIQQALQSRIEVEARFDQVDGLKRGDAVWYAGVPVGLVHRVALEGAGEVDVTLRVDEAARGSIPHDVYAKIGSDGLIGNAVIVLEGGTPGSRSLEPGDALASKPTVSASQLMAEVQATNDNLLAISSSLRTVMDGVAAGEGSIGRLIQDEQLYMDVSETMVNLKVASSEAQTASSGLARFTRDLNEPGNLAHDLINDTETYPAVARTIANLESSSADASALAEKLEASVGDTGTPIGVLLHDRQAGQSLGETLGNLSTGSELLNEDLEAVQHNFLLRGYFKKKEKRERKEAEAKAEAQDAQPPPPFVMQTTTSVR